MATRYHITPDSNRPDLKPAYVYADSHTKAASLYAKRAGYTWAFPSPELSARAIIVHGQDGLAKCRFTCSKYFGLID